MRFPTVSAEDLESLASDLTAGAVQDLAAAISWNGDGPEVDLEPLTELSADIMSALRKHGDSPTVGDEFEGPWCGPLHRSLREVPLRVLDEPGFWRYVCAAHFWQFAVARHRDTFENGDWTRIREYVDGTSNTECVPTRMFIRAQAIRQGDDYSLAAAVSGAGDLWRSHIIRVRTSYDPALARAFIQQQISDKMTIPEVREHAKRIKRLRSNLVLSTYDEGAAAALLEDLDLRRTDDQG